MLRVASLPVLELMTTSADVGYENKNQNGISNRLRFWAPDIEKKKTVSDIKRPAEKHEPMNSARVPDGIGRQGKSGEQSDGEQQGAGE